VQPIGGGELRALRKLKREEVESRAQLSMRSVAWNPSRGLRHQLMSPACTN
jgi:hypothetical protein